jgi:opacity protein-like surface antigen
MNLDDKECNTRIKEWLVINSKSVVADLNNLYTGVYMRNILLTAIMILGLIVSVAAQNTVIDSKGAMGLQFSIGGNGNIGVGGVIVAVPSGSYYGIGGKYFVADKLGLGLGLYLAGDDTSATDEQNFYFGIRPSLSYTLVKKDPISLYTGGYLAPGIEKNTIAGTSNSANVLGFGGELGAEWAIATQVSLAAEYTFGLSLYDGYTSWGGGTTRAYLTFYF